VVQTNETEDSLEIFPLSPGAIEKLAADTGSNYPKVVAIDTYDDHRMAMAFALAACAPMSITINNPGCVRKTYPYYFTDLGRMTSESKKVEDRWESEDEELDMD